MRYWPLLISGFLPLLSTIGQAACLPTLGTEDCFRGGDPVVQAIEHHYLDAPQLVHPDSWSKRHHQVKVSPSRGATSAFTGSAPGHRAID
jgi:hypothetical protein